MTSNYFNVSVRYDKEIELLLKECMKVLNCDKSTAIREILKYFNSIGGVNLLK